MGERYQGIGGGDQGFEGGEPMTDYEREKVRDLISGLSPEEKEIAREVLEADKAVLKKVEEE